MRRAALAVAVAVYMSVSCVGLVSSLSAAPDMWVCGKYASNCSTPGASNSNSTKMIFHFEGIVDGALTATKRIYTTPAACRTSTSDITSPDVDAGLQEQHMYYGRWQDLGASDEDSCMGAMGAMAKQQPNSSQQCRLVQIRSVMQLHAVAHTRGAVKWGCSNMHSGTCHARTHAQIYTHAHAHTQRIMPVTCHLSDPSLALMPVTCQTPR